MLPWKRRKAEAQPQLTLKNTAPHREASTLLAFIAGEFAAEIARLWPAPHTAFVLAPAARRQLVFLALALQRNADGWTEGASFARQALEAPLKTAIRALAPGAPAGLARALGRIGETAWSAEDYGLLLQRLADERTAKVLRHAEAISPDEIRVLSALPMALVEAGGVLLKLSEEQCAIAAECFEGIVRRDGEAQAVEVAQTWARSPDAGRLFRQVLKDMKPPEAQPFHPGTERLKPLATRQALSDAARRYRNCLNGRVLDGFDHYYEWTGTPGAIIGVSRDHLFGWRLDEALGEANAPLPDEVRAEIQADLKLMGVHVGHGVYALERMALRVAQAAGCPGDES